MDKIYGLEIFDEKGELSTNVAYMLYYYEKKMREYKEKQDELHQVIKSAMEKNNIEKFSNEQISVAYVAERQQQRFDSTSFKKDNPELYAEYLEDSTVKAHVRISIK